MIFFNLKFKIREKWLDYTAKKYKHFIEVDWEVLKSVMRHYCGLKLTSKDKRNVHDFYHELSRQVIESPKKRLDLKNKK